jgi:endonuclease G
MRKARLKYVLIFIAVTAALWYIEKQLAVFNSDNAISQIDTAAKYREFSDEFLPESTTGSIVKHGYYTLSYNESHEQAEWVAYELQDWQLDRKDIERPYFEQDPRVVTGSADWRNYRNSGFDRGHLCPAGDRGFSREAYLETFLTSNVAPQLPGFNAGIWNSLEQKVRYWASRKEGLFVVTGGVLKPGLPTIGYEQVSVPAFYYKIVLDARDDTFSVIAFLIPHREGNRSLFHHVVTVDRIEELTGIDFFSGLPDEVEGKLERSQSRKGW